MQAIRNYPRSTAKEGRTKGGIILRVKTYSPDTVYVHALPLIVKKCLAFKEISAIFSKL
jgi:hypothetical protein